MNEDRRNFLRMTLGGLILPFLPIKKESYTETLARWWNTINCWKWPHDMPGKPDGFDKMLHVFFRDDPRRYAEPCKLTASQPFMKGIEVIIGKKECLRWHHLHNLGRTNKQFESWWDSWYKEVEEKADENHTD